jgi:hypothetical protein
MITLHVVPSKHIRHTLGELIVDLTKSDAHDAANHMQAVLNRIMEDEFLVNIEEE